MGIDLEESGRTPNCSRMSAPIALQTGKFLAAIRLGTPFCTRLAYAGCNGEETNMPTTTERDLRGVNVALLRGINVGGKNKLPMKDLAAMFTDAGFSDVRTYIQSGNVLFRGDPELQKEIPSLISASISDRFGLQIPVVTRTAHEFRAIVEANPFANHTDEPNKLHVAFLSDLPNPANVAALDPDRSPPDKFAAVGCEVYLHCPNGMARTKLTNAYFDSTLAATSTMRNWKTVLKLHDLAIGAG